MFGGECPEEVMGFDFPEITHITTEVLHIWQLLLHDNVITPKVT